MIGFIYKLICSETDKCYIGSTGDPKRRLLAHMRENNECSSNKLIYPKMEILEIVYGTKDDLLLKEKNYILNNDCVNLRVPKRTKKEFYELKKKENPNYLKELYIKGGGAERNLRTLVNCPCGGKYVKRNKKIHFQTIKHKNFKDSL